MAKIDCYVNNFNEVFRTRNCLFVSHVSYFELIEGRPLLDSTNSPCWLWLLTFQTSFTKSFRIFLCFCFLFTFIWIIKKEENEILCRVTQFLFLYPTSDVFGWPFGINYPSLIPPPDKPGEIRVMTLYFNLGNEEDMKIWVIK